MRLGFRSPPALAAALVTAILVLPAPGVAQYTADYVPEVVANETFPLSIRSIMRAEEIVGQSPASVRWSADGETIYFTWVPGGNEWDADREWYRVPAEGGEPVRLTDEEEDDLNVATASGDISPDGDWELIGLGGDIWLRNRDSGEMEQLTATRSGEGQASWSADGTEIFYRAGEDLFAMSVETGRIRQLTDVRSGEPPSFEADEESDDQRRFLIEQQRELFEFIRRQAREDSVRRAEREAAFKEPPEEGELQPTYIPNGERVGALVPNGDASYIAVSLFQGSGNDTEATPVPFWITESGYTEPRNVRSKVGDSEPGRSRAGFIDASTGEVTFVDAAPEDFEGDVSTQLIGWNDAGTHALIQGGSDDDENRWLWTVDVATGERTLVDHLYDEAWVGRICGGCRGWLPGEDVVWFASEESGFSHLYTVNADGTGRTALTAGSWEVQDADILELDRAEDRDRFWVETNEGDPANTHQGWLDYGDRGEEPVEIDYVTEGDGRFDVTWSPDLERAAVLASFGNRPSELFVADADDVMEMAEVTTTPTDEWLSFNWLWPEIVDVPADDGIDVPARIYRPADLGAEPNGAAVIFVHGAGYLQNVHNGWSSYYREYMFHHFLAANGYTVLDIDYRGSAGYGRDWRTAIYRFMGGADLSDQVDGAEWLVANEGIDADRIGLYGGSYGGFITLMALFTAGDTFKAGAALRSVTDWAHYNDGYTSNILNDPQEDDEAYRMSSPIYHAEGFGPDQHLLIPHGMVDTNVHFSDVVRLAQRLIELGKENWEMAVYPVENHGFTVPSSWTDEYRRIFELFERTLSEPGCTEDGELCAVPGR